MELSERLSKYNTDTKPAEGRGKFPHIRSSGSGDGRKGGQSKDIENLCSRLAAPKQAPEDDQRTPAQTPRSGRKMKKEELSALIERLSSFDPALHPAEGRGVPPKERRYSQVKGSPRKLDQDDLGKVFERLAKYNPNSWPPGSRDRKESLLPRGNTYSDSEIGGVVERLTNYDTKKWPPESAGTREPWSDGNHWNFRPKKSKPAT